MVATATLADNEAYIGVTGGGNVNQENGVYTNPDYYTLTGKGGYLFDTGLVKIGPEIEYSHFFLNTAGVGATGGDDNFGRLMFNAVAKTDFGWFVNPYAFGGVGVLFDDRFSVPTGGTLGTHTGADEFAWQAGAGLDVPLTDHISLDGGYRYVDVQNVVGSGSHELFAGVKVKLW